MMMPGRKFNAGSSYRYGFNGQEKELELNENITTAEYWEYDSRIGRRWNLDPKPTIDISDYSTFGNNPIVNVDPDGAYFFGLFGSTSAQRQSAKKLQSETGGTIRNITKKDINVQYRIWVTEEKLSYSSEKANDPTLLKGVTVASYRTYFDSKSGEASGSDYYDAVTRSWRKYESVSTYKPDLYDKWSESDNIIAQASYSAVNSFYVTGQNLFTKRFSSNNYAVSLNGEVTTPKENIEAFIDVGTSFIPATKTVKGFSYLEKLSAPQFSKLFKGTIIARSQPFIRGKLNKGLNYIFTSYNGFIPSGKVLFDLVDMVKPDQSQTDNH